MNPEPVWWSNEALSEKPKQQQQTECLLSSLVPKFA